MVMHECQDDASDMFYCYGIGGERDPEGKGLLDWYAREDDRAVDPRGRLNTVSCIIYCPFCGTKLPGTGEDAVGNTYRSVEIQEEEAGPSKGLDGARVFLVTWTNPEPSICLVSAKNERDALTAMDQIADPSYCRVEEYQGPLWLSIDLKLKYHHEETMVNGTTEFHTVVDDVCGCADHIEWEMFTQGDEGIEMKDEIIRVAFPNYSAYLEKRWDREDEEVTEADEAKCKEAIQQDFDMELRRVQYRLSEAEKDGGTEEEGGV